MENSKREKFEAFLSTLPAKKREDLFAAMRKMSAEERAETIDMIVARYEKQQKQSAPSKTAPAKTQEKPAKKEAPKKEASPKEVAPKKSVNPMTVVTWVVVVVCVFILCLTAWNNREDLKSLFTGETFPSESSSETEATTGMSESETTTSTETSAPETTAAPTPLPLASDAPDLTGVVVVLDPGHQAVTSERTETVLPGGTVEKPCCTSGSVGTVTGVCEYDLTLQYAVAVKGYLEQCGASVVLTRSVSDIDLSNQERAQMATASDCDVFIRLHADGANDSKTSGVRVYVPEGSEFLSEDKASAEILADLISSASGLENSGAYSTTAYTGLNYATAVHAFQLNLGFLTNSDDEAVLVSEENIYAVAVVLSQFCENFK